MSTPAHDERVDHFRIVANPAAPAGLPDRASCGTLDRPDRDAHSAGSERPRTVQGRLDQPPLRGGVSPARRIAAASRRRRPSLAQPPRRTPAPPNTITFAPVRRAKTPASAMTVAEGSAQVTARLVRVRQGVAGSATATKSVVVAGPIRSEGCGYVRAELDVRAITKAVVEAFDEHDVPDSARRAVLAALRSGAR